MRMTHGVLLLVLVPLCGCATTIRDKSTVNYVADAFGPVSMRDEGLAQLPVVAGQGQEGFRRPLAERLAGSCRMTMETGRFLDWQETMEALNAADLSGVYQGMIGTYRETAILPRESVSILGEALHVRYLLFCSLERFHSQTKTSYSVFTGLSSQREAAVNAFCQVWDAANGDVVWEGSACAESQGGELTYDKPYEEYARVAAEGLTRRLFRLPKSRSLSP